MVTKLLCYSRSSSVTSKLFPDYYHQTGSSEDHIDVLNNHVYDSSKLKVCKFSNTISQRHLENELYNFWESADLEVFLLVFDIHQSSRKKEMYINHVRIIMEQVETDHSLQNNGVKLVALLLLFPPTSFIKACYPCIFLDGWTHYYLDSVSQATLGESRLCNQISIRNWFRQFCLQDSNEEINLEAFLLSILNDAIPILVSRLHFYQMNGHKASEEICKLLQSNEDVSVKSILVKRFKDCWNAEVVGEYIKRAASYTHKRDSTLNLADQIQVIVRFLFTEFLVYMIHIMSRNKGRELFMDSSPLAPFSKELLKSIDIPTLSDLEGLKSHNIVQEDKNNKEYSMPRKFPFFSKVFQSVNSIINTCREHILKDKSEVAFQGIEEKVCDEAINDWESVVAEIVSDRISESKCVCHS
jgi:hypothetical protein